MKESGQYGYCLARSTFVVASIILSLTLCFARERGPRVEVVCPSPPVPVVIGKNKALVYELYVTNFDTVPLTLKSIQVFAAEAGGEPLTTFENDKLSAAMTRTGAAMSMSSDSRVGAEDTRMIDPGGRNTVFVWIELPVNTTVPTILRHRMIFSSMPKGAVKASDATIEDFPLPVSQDSTPILSPPFSGGVWLAGDGPANNSNHRRSILAIDGHVYSSERFAVDWVKVGPNGDSRHDGTTKNENWWGWGEPVLAVADGEVTEVVDEFSRQPSAGSASRHVRQHCREPHHSADYTKPFRHLRSSAKREHQGANG
jgi:murein DD-endopeptidase